MDERICEQDGVRYRPTREDSRFCSDRCRARWHREHDPHGEVRSVRRLVGGRVGVVVHFSEAEAERALQFEVRQHIVMGAVSEVDQKETPT